MVFKNNNKARDQVKEIVYLKKWWLQSPLALLVNVYSVIYHYVYHDILKLKNYLFGSIYIK